MRKLIAALAVAATLTGISGCGGNDDVDIAYVTMYVANTGKLELHREPDKNSEVITDLDAGTAVSYIKDSRNGFSEVAYNGDVGYVMATYLSRALPDGSEAKQPETSATVPMDDSGYYIPTNPVPSDIVSNETDAGIDGYIAAVIRPAYYDVENNIADYSEKQTENGSEWYKSDILYKRMINAGKGNSNLTRCYYYADNGGVRQLSFALMYDENYEYRLYFKDNKLIRWVTPEGGTYNKPESDTAKLLASMAVGEGGI